jgi:hypothetical protein
LGERSVQLNKSNVVVICGVRVELVDDDATRIGVEFGDVLYICVSQ